MAEREKHEAFMRKMAEMKAMRTATVSRQGQAAAQANSGAHAAAPVAVSSSAPTVSSGGGSGIEGNSNRMAIGRTRQGTGAISAPTDHHSHSHSSPSATVSNAEMDSLRRRLAEVERDRDAYRTELETMKRKRDEAKARILKQKGQQLNAMKDASAQRRAAATNNRADNAARRETKRMTKANVAGHITKLIQEMSNLEQAISLAEDGRIRAENELIEYANEKRKAEENIIQLALEIEKVNSKITALTTGSLSGDVPLKVKKELLSIKENMDMCKRLAEQSDGRQASSSPSGPPGVGSRRPTGIAPPVAPMGAPPAGPMGAPPPMGGSSASAVPEGGSLLAQIRLGKQLKQVDLQAVRKERQKSSRNSMAVLSSLTDTLRCAMEKRSVGIAGGEDDDDDSDEAWDF
eukprot:TRINITY_DN5170_c0_g1_i1.p1 TRINITY_DN5170_c0_g1~~TRINITY_DN5170_c0_g1_i1.p1  ORF type:complete len:416 (-),score=129.02 TRINITY_DN5170_c0_g1_i1:38-1252(-)